MSGFWSRRKPRWSRFSEVVLLAAPIAGLPCFSATVLVGPPLLASGPILGVGFWESPGAVKPSQPIVIAVIMLWPPEVNVPRQSGALPVVPTVFSAISELAI